MGPSVGAWIKIARGLLGRERSQGLAARERLQAITHQRRRSAGQNSGWAGASADPKRRRARQLVEGLRENRRGDDDLAPACHAKTHMGEIDPKHVGPAPGAFAPHLCQLAGGGRPLVFVLAGDVSLLAPIWRRASSPTRCSLVKPSGDA